MNSPTPRWILFDLDGTLWDHKSASARAVDKVCALHGFPSEPFLQSFHRANEELWRELAAGRSDFDTVRIDRFRMVLEHLGREVSENLVTEISDLYLEHYLGGASFFPGVTELLESAARVANLAIVTNAPHRTQQVKLSFLGAVRDHFRHVICPEDVGGSMKPSADYFRGAHHILGEPAPETILIVGDSWGDDLSVPVAWGWQTVWISHGRPTPSSGNNTLVFPSPSDFSEYIARFS